MSQIDPLVFGAVVLALVGLSVFLPRFFSRQEGPTADDIYLDSLPSAYDRRVTSPAPPEQQSTTAGAPRAVAPTRQPVASSAPPSDGPAPLKLPAQ